MTAGQPVFFPPDSGPLSELTRAIAVLRHEPEEIAQRFNLRFTSGFDDLDQLSWAEIAGTRGRHALVRHRHVPTPGTEVLISSASRNPRLDLLHVLSVLTLSEDDLLWTHPDATVVTSLRPRAQVRRFSGRAVQARAKSTTLARNRSRRSGARASGKKK